MTLTPVGVFYAERIQSTLASLASATQEASLFLKRGGLLRLGMPPTFGTRWLIPRIGEFLEAHRDIEVVFATWLPDSDASSATDLDAVIHAGAGAPPFSRCDKLFDEQLVIVAHPKLAATILSYGDLKTRTLLVHALRPSAWADWFNEHGLDKKSAQPVLSFSLFSMVLSAVADQLGIALVPEQLVQRELAKGELVKLFPEAPLYMHSLYFAYPEAGDVHPPLQTFRRWLIEQCGGGARQV